MRPSGRVDFSERRKSNFFIHSPSSKGPHRHAPVHALVGVCGRLSVATLTSAQSQKLEWILWESAVVRDCTENKIGKLVIMILFW